MKKQIKDIEIDTSKDYIAKVTTNEGEFEISLDQTNAPINTARFASVASSQGYDGLTFHRIIQGFMIQGGDPNGTGSGGYGKEVVGELPQNGYPKGTVAWAKTAMAPAGSGDSQFFIMSSEGVNLPPEYGYIGEVTKGLEVIDMLEKTETDYSDKPLVDTIIEKVEIFADGEKITV